MRPMSICGHQVSTAMVKDYFLSRPSLPLFVDGATISQLVDGRRRTYSTLYITHDNNNNILYILYHINRFMMMASKKWKPDKIFVLFIMYDV